jgi:Rrf2 family nitric oxide-sensitive transcriptional repressor
MQQLYDPARDYLHSDDMQLTRFADLGLRVLMYLTPRDRSQLVTIAEIASKLGVPRNHLIKVVNRLGKLSWIIATRGRNGGLRLAVDPRALKLGEVVRELERSTELIDCTNPPCALRNGCRLKGVLNEGLTAFYEAVNHFSLADVVQAPTGETIIQMHRQFLALDSLKVSENHSAGHRS